MYVQTDIVYTHVYAYYRLLEAALRYFTGCVYTFKSILYLDVRAYVMEYSKWRDAIFQVLYAYKNVYFLVISHSKFIGEIPLKNFHRRCVWIGVYIYKRDLCIYKRALCSHQRDLMYPQKSPIYPPKEPLDSTKEPYASTKEPCASAKEPYVSAKRAIWFHKRALCICKKTLSIC